MISLRYIKNSNRISVESDTISFSFNPDVFIESWNLFEHKIDKINDFLNAVGWNSELNAELKNVFLSYPINPTNVNKAIRLALNPKRNKGKRKLKLQLNKKCSLEKNEFAHSSQPRRSPAAIAKSLVDQNFNAWNYCSRMSAITHNLSYFYDFIDSIPPVSDKVFCSLFDLFHSQVDFIQKNML